MSMLEMIYMTFVFAVAFAVALAVLYQFVLSPEQKRLENVARPGESELAPAGSAKFDWLSRIGLPLASLSLPKENWEESHLRIKFVNAGYRSNTAPTAFFAAKTLLAIFLPVLLIIYSLTFGTAMTANLFLAWMVILSAFGYISPNLYLERRISRRKKQIFENFPDAIDLMTVCVEAGLGLDEAIARVSDEIRINSPVLSEELHLVSLELRAGGGREQALRNLALRTGVEDIDMLVATLVQADRFGTSIGDSLRVHSESLRTKRRLLAEEEAAKIPVKLLFPLSFCIFPALLLVLLGPAGISVYRTLLPALKAATQ